VQWHPDGDAVARQADDLFHDGLVLRPWLSASGDRRPSYQHCVAGGISLAEVGP